MVADVQNMLSVNERPWHGLGVVLDTPPTIQEAIKLAGLDWAVEKRPLFRVNSDGTQGPQSEAYSIVRLDNNKELGIVKKGYVPLQNVDVFDWFNPFIEQNEVSIETAGCLGEGERLWVMAKLNRDPSVVTDGDEILKYLMLSNSHDGSLAIRVGYTPIRVVCSNTLAMAHGNKYSKFIRVKHTKSSKVSLDKLREVMDSENAQFEATAEQYRFLRSHMFKSEDVKKYVKLIITGDDKPDADISTRSKNIINDVIGLLEDPRQKVAGMEGTWWAAYNAVNQYFNYDAGRNANSRMNSLWFGPNADANGYALKLATEMANGS